jgi:hypothetical protein
MMSVRRDRWGRSVAGSPARDNAQWVEMGSAADLARSPSWDPRSDQRAWVSFARSRDQEFEAVKQRFTSSAPPRDQPSPQNARVKFG